MTDSGGELASIRSIKAKEVDFLFIPIIIKTSMGLDLLAVIIASMFVIKA